MGIKKNKMSKPMSESIMSGMRKSVMHPSLEFNMKTAKTADDMICKQHKEFFEYICIEDFDNYKVGQLFCQHCANQIQDAFEAKYEDRKFPIISFTRIIKKNKGKISEIKNLDITAIMKNLSAMNVDCQRSLKCLTDKISPLPKQLESFIEEIQEGVYGRVGGDDDTSEKIKEYKEFIDNIKLNPQGEAVLKDIGENLEMKSKYVQLAQFLLKWTGLGDIKKDYTGISDTLKACILTLNEQRFANVTRMDMLMKSLLGPMYDFIFQLEDRRVDEEFRKKFFPEYFNEPYVNNIVAKYKVEIQGKDDRIAELEALLKKQKNEISALNSLNTEYKLEIDRLNGDMESMKLEFEK